MATARRIAVIGAGITGLAAALALQDAGAAVRVFEKGEPGQAQSAGLARIFRLSHGVPALVHLAMRAYDGWQVWERRFGGQLLGQEGMIVTGDASVEEYERALRAAGAPCRVIDAAEATSLLPIGHFPQEHLLFDTLAGSIRVRRTIDCLCTALTTPITLDAVHEIRITGSGAQVGTGSETWDCDGVLIAAGLDIPALASQVGLQIPGDPWQIIRFTFEPREPHAGRQLACWIDGSGAYGGELTAYALPVGTTSRYAVGASHRGQAPTPLDMPREEFRRAALARAQTYVRAALPGLIPDPVDEVWCAGTSVDYPDEDGFRAYRSGPVVAVYGTNLFKFAPLLGELFAETVLHAETPAELRPEYLA